VPAAPVAAAPAELIVVHLQLQELLTPVAVAAAVAIMALIWQVVLVDLVLLFYDT
jgi:hypothetical protein